MNRGDTRFCPVPHMYCYIYIVQCGGRHDTPQTPSVHLGLFFDDTFIYETDHKEDYVLRKAAAIETYECWNMKINDDKTQAIISLTDLGPMMITLQ
jgi:hypothetical protein